MRASVCAWEPEALRAIAEGRGLEHLEEDLREHLAACGACADLIEVGIALARDRESAVRSAPVPASGAVWWRMRLRMRREAEQSARRTVTLVQGAILGTCSLVALGVLSWVSAPQQIWLSPWSHWFVLALAAWVLLILAAVRWALADDPSASLLSGSGAASVPQDADDR